MIRILLTLFLFLAVAGCGKKHDETSKDGDGHEHGAEEPAVGASFRPGKGILVTEETKKLMEIEIVSVVEEKLQRELSFNVQVFSEDDILHAKEGHSDCNLKASGSVPASNAEIVKVGARILLGSTNPIPAVVLSTGRALALGELEIVVGATNHSAHVKPGEFLQARLLLPGGEEAVAVPKSAVLRTLEGTFCYVVNGDAFLRTEVKVGAESDKSVEILDGLFPGDMVVSKPVQALWLIELRATKGGGHSH